MSAIDNVEKRFRDILRLANQPIPRHYYTFSSPSLNWLAAGGRDYRGIRSGSLIELLGAKSSGKSTLALDLVGNAQKRGDNVLWIDLERWFDPGTVGPYAQSLGVDTSNLVVAYPTEAEEALTLAREVLKGDTFDVVVIDSVAATVPEGEWEKEYNETSKLGEQARLIGRFVTQASMLAFDNNKLVIMLNQIRANISPMSQKSTKRFGGKAYEHMLDIAFELTVIQHTDKERKKTVQIFTDKNRLGGEERLKTELVIEYGKGIRADLDILEQAIKVGIVRQSGARYEYHTYKGHGKENSVKEFPLDDIKRELETYYQKGN